MLIALSVAVAALIAPWGAEMVTRRDRRLLERIAQGDRRALDELYTHYEEYVKKLVRQFVSPFAAKHPGLVFDEEEIIALVNLEFVRSIALFRRDAKLTTWLYTVVRRTVIKYCLAEIAREDPRQREHLGADGELRDTEIADPGQSALTMLLTEERDRQVTEAIAALPESFRMVYVLAELKECTYEEIAVTLGIPVGTVRSRLNRARRDLRKALAEYFQS